MTRIVTTTYRYKRPPRKRKAVTLEAPAVVTTKSSRRPVGGTEEAAAEVPMTARTTGQQAQPSTPREAARVIAQPPANDDRKPAIVRNEPNCRRRLTHGRREGSLAGPVYRGYLRASSILMRRPAISTISKRQPS